MPAGDLRSVLSGRNFRRLFAVRLTGQFADGLLQAALATFVLFSPERQATAAKVAVAFAVLLLPYSVIGPFAGVFLDRWRRRQVLVRANALRAVAVVAVIALVHAEHDGADLAIAVLVTLGIGRFVLAGLSASLPHVVDRSGLVVANALSPTAGTMASVGGSLAGVVLRAISGGGDGGSVVVLVTALLMYLMAAAVATLMDRDLLGPTGKRPDETLLGVARGLVDGGRHLRSRPVAARAMAVVVLHRVAFGALTVIALLLIRNTLNPPSQADAALRQFAYVTAAAAGGALLGAVLTPWRTRRVGAVRWSATTLQWAAVSIAAILTTSLPGLLVAGFFLGLAGQAVKVCSDTTVQREVSDDHLGRVFAIYDMVLNVGLVGGICAVAFTAPASGDAPWVYAGVAALLLAASVWYLRHQQRPGRAG